MNSYLLSIYLLNFDLFINFRFIYLFSICLLSIWFLILMYIFNLFWISRIRFLYFIQISNHFSWSFYLIFLFDLFGIVYCYFCNIYFDFCLKFWNDLNLFCILKSFSFAFSLEYDIRMVHLRTTALFGMLNFDVGQEVHFWLVFPTKNWFLIINFSGRGFVVEVTAQWLLLQRKVNN